MAVENLAGRVTVANGGQLTDFVGHTSRSIGRSVATFSGAVVEKLDKYFPEMMQDLRTKHEPQEARVFKNKTVSFRRGLDDLRKEAQLGQALEQFAGISDDERKKVQKVTRA